MTDEDCATILTGLQEIESRIENGEFAWRVDREDVYMNVEAALIDIVGEPAKKLHTARSRNDQVITDVRLWCRDAIDQLLGRIELLQASIVKLAVANEGIVVPGYTHLQRAQPLLLQHLLLAYVEQDGGRSYSGLIHAFGAIVGPEIGAHLFEWTFEYWRKFAN